MPSPISDMMSFDNIADDLAKDRRGQISDMMNNAVQDNAPYAQRLLTGKPFLQPDFSSLLNNATGDNAPYARRMLGGSK